jgi:hypothetical protein
MGKETGQPEESKGSVRRGERKRDSRRQVKKKRSERDQGSHFLRVVFSLGESYSIRLYWFARGREGERAIKKQRERERVRGRGGEKEERNQEGR